MWEAPNWYSYYPRLQSINEYRQLFGLIVTALGLMDGTTTNYLDYLQHIRDSKDYLNNQKEEAKIPLIYGQLNILAGGDTKTTVKEEIWYVCFSAVFHSFCLLLTILVLGSMTKILFTYPKLEHGTHIHPVFGQRNTFNSRKKCLLRRHTVSKSPSSAKFLV